MTTRPHDALFKAAFESPAAAAALLRALLPAALRDSVVWTALRSEPGSFVDAALADRHNDLLFSARFGPDDADRLYLLLEHRSTGDAAMPLRILSYETRIWDRIRKERPGTLLPPIIAVVVSHVPGGWPTSRSMSHMFEPRALRTPGLRALVPRFSLLIDDLAHLSNAELQARSLAAFQKLALWLLRDARSPARLLDSFDAWTDAWLQAARDPGGDQAITTLITYMLRVIHPLYRDALRAKIRLLGPHIEETAMSIADQLQEEGRLRGQEEGRLRGRQEALFDAVHSQLVIKFRALDAADEARLRAASVELLERYVRRVLVAESIADVFVD